MTSPLLSDIEGDQPEDPIAAAIAAVTRSKIQLNRLARDAEVARRHGIADADIAAFAASSKGVRKRFRSLLERRFDEMNTPPAQTRPAELDELVALFAQTENQARAIWRDVARWQRRGLSGDTIRDALSRSDGSRASRRRELIGAWREDRQSQRGRRGVTRELENELVRWSRRGLSESEIRGAIDQSDGSRAGRRRALLDAWRDKQDRRDSDGETPTTRPARPDRQPTRADDGDRILDGILRRLDAILELLARIIELLRRLPDALAARLRNG